MTIKRKCSTCKKSLHLSKFHRNNGEKYGREYECKECKAIRDKVYYRKNREHILLRKRLYDTKKALSKAIDSNNTEIIKQASNRLITILNN